MADTWLTKEQLAERFGLINAKTGKPRTYTIGRKVASGEWPSHKVMDEIRFSPEDVAVIEDLVLHPAAKQRKVRAAAQPQLRSPKPKGPKEKRELVGGFADLTPLPITNCRKRRTA